MNASLELAIGVAGGFLLRGVVAALCLLPPTMAMGASSRFSSSSTRAVPRR
ncbi:MAG: hypothetical protein HY048_00620 [Acidobacteria bacterium]|nr:hypothetical protein [Acidobacteriota bacterium]